MIDRPLHDNNGIVYCGFESSPRYPRQTLHIAFVVPANGSGWGGKFDPSELESFTNLLILFANSCGHQEDFPTTIIGVPEVFELVSP